MTIWYIFPVLVSCTMKNLATLNLGQPPPHSRTCSYLSALVGIFMPTLRHWRTWCSLRTSSSFVSVGGLWGRFDESVSAGIYLNTSEKYGYLLLCISPENFVIDYQLHFLYKFLYDTLSTNQGAKPTTSSYTASVVKMYNSTNSIACL
jgi:hypothetical protein